MLNTPIDRPPTVTIFRLPGGNSGTRPTTHRDIDNAPARLNPDTLHLREPAARILYAAARRHAVAGDAYRISASSLLCDEGRGSRADLAGRPGPRRRRVLVHARGPRAFHARDVRMCVALPTMRC